MGPKKDRIRQGRKPLLSGNGATGSSDGLRKAGGRLSFKGLLILAAVLAVTVAVYSNSVGNGFVNWDDDKNVYENVFIRELSADNLKVYFTRPLIAMYTPVVYLSFALDYRLGGLDPRVYHTSNLLLHLANTGLVFILMMMLAQRLEIAVIVSVFFALHPLNTGAVAPVSTRSGLLYSFFSLASMLFYMRYLRAELKLRHLVLAFVFFLPAVLSKSAAVVLPLVLLLMDYYYGRKLDLRAFAEKAPFFALSVLFGALTFFFRQDAGHIGSQYLFTAFERGFLVAHSLAFYLLQLLVPADLSAYHPYPDKADGLLPVWYYLSPLLIAAAVAAIYRLKKHRKELLFGSLFFLINILLILKIIPMGGEIVCDRYAYLPSIGLFFMIGWAYCRVSDAAGTSAGVKKKLFTAVLILWLAAFAVISHERIGVWENSITLYSDIIEKYPSVLLAYTNRGSARIGQGDYAGAIADFSAALERDPQYVPGYNNRGYAYRKMGRFEKAVEDYDTAVRISPRADILYNNRGFTLMLMGRLDAAEKDLSTALALNPENADTLNSMAELSAARGDAPAACRYLEEAVRKGYGDRQYIRTSATYDKVRWADCFRKLAGEG
jgi:tetratricopeptide (TPR) repeat protein